MPAKDDVRVTSWQYFIRNVPSFDEFRDQVTALVETAEDYDSRMVVFPEYFTTQLLTLGNVRRPIEEQIYDLACQEERFINMMSELADENNIHIVAGTIPGFSQVHPGRIQNRCHVFGPGGKHGIQLKLHITRWEVEEWRVGAGSNLRIFETDFGRFAVAICYDVEFPEIARVAAQHGAHMLVVPSCTDDRQGYCRVRYCAQARAIENQMYVVTSCTVGSQPRIPAVSLNWGQSAMFTPCDFAFARDGILAEGTPNIEMAVIGDMHYTLVEQTREDGTVLPLRDSQKTNELIGVTEVEKL